MNGQCSTWVGSGYKSVWPWNKSIEISWQASQVTHSSERLDCETNPDLLTSFGSPLNSSSASIRNDRSEDENNLWCARIRNMTLPVWMLSGKVHVRCTAEYTAWPSNTSPSNTNPRPTRPISTSSAVQIRPQLEKLINWNHVTVELNLGGGAELAEAARHTYHFQKN